METNQTRTGYKQLIVGAIIILLLVNGITLYLFLHEQHKKNEVITEKITVQENYSNLEKDYQSLTDELDKKSIEIGQLKGKNSELDKIIAERQQMIEQTKQELANAYNQNALTTTSLDKARRMIDRQTASIADLEKKVQEYAEQNQVLTVKNTTLETDLTCEKETTTELADRNQNLTKKIETAAVLELPKVQVAAVRMKNNGEEVCVDKAKSAEKLKISFETGVNKALDPGTYPLYVRIINPKGETIAINEQGSGTIPATASAKPIPYTKKTNLQWNQKNKKVVVYWQRYVNDPGTYRVEVYQTDKLIGKGAVRLS